MSEQVTAVIPTRGMHCRSCETLIEMAVNDLEGVSGVRADRAANVTEVTFDPSLVDVQAIVEAIKGAGYDAEPV